MSKHGIIISTSPEETERLAVVMGANLRGGELIELASDLGSGKTTFTRGLVRGAGSTDAVASPTFTISRVYKGPKFDIHHFDFYRLQEAGLAAHELQDLLNDPQIVIVVEWANVVADVLPANRLTIEITAQDETSRRLHCKFTKQLEYLMEGVC